MNPTIPTTAVPTPNSSGGFAFSSSAPLSKEALAINSSNMSPLDQQKAFAALSAKGGTSPTVMTDSNIRESTIPSVINKSNSYLSQNAPTTGADTEKKDATSPDNTYESLYNNAFGSDSVKSIGNDPATTAMLQNIKDMQSKSDASTAAQLDAIHSGYLAREALTKQSQATTTGLLKGLLMSDGSYRTGSGANLIGAKEQFDIQALTNLSNEETSAKAAIYKAKNESDFQLMDKANTLLENIQTKKQNLATKIADAVTQKNKDDRAYNLDVEKFNHGVANDEKQNARELEKIQQGRYEYRDLKDEFGNTIGTQVFDKESRTPNQPISVIGAPGSGKPGVNGVLNPVQVQPDGTLDTKQQNDFLKALPPNIATMVKELTDYKMNPANISNRGNTRATIMSYAHQFDPTFDESQYAIRSKVNQDYTSGKTSQNVKSLNTAINHTGDLAKDFVNLPNGDITKFNSVKDWWSQNVGHGDVNKVINDLNALGGELAKTYKGTAGTDTEIAAIEKGINVNSSPEQFKAFIESSMNLLGGRVSALEEGYQQTMGKSIGYSLLNPSTSKLLSQLKDNGYDINVPGVIFSDKNSYLKANPTNGSENLKTAYDHLKAAGLPTTPENILQYAQSI